MKNNNSPKYLVFDLIGVIFNYDPALLETKPSEAFTPIEDGVRILQQCYKQKNNPNSSVQKLYALSNISTISYNALTTNYPHIFELFDNIMGSFESGYKKPDVQTFYHFLSTYNVQPEECIFIDDKEANVLAARAIGMQGIVCTDFVHVEEQLKKFGVL